MNQVCAPDINLEEWIIKPLMIERFFHLGWKSVECAPGLEHQQW
jgi:hypothetical protein